MGRKTDGQRDRWPDGWEEIHRNGKTEMDIMIDR
jgi:hypothetical protein